ncbi:MAG: SPOR domain-containing protein [Gammaproteobacteria bacterium]|nr:SPOR domain-containing protein [Gammaproteobacteria bacterium]
MSQDFAKTRKTANKSSKKKPARSATRPASTENKPWSWFYSGLFTGILLSVIAYFLPAQLRPDQGASNNIAVNPGEQTTEESGTDLDFYEYLPQAEVVVNVVPVEIAESALQEEVDPVTYFLQAGSFLDPNDANELRARLILMNLETRIQDTNLRGRTWYRVQAGPFVGRNSVDTAQNTLIENNIDPIRLIIPSQ